MTTNLAAILNAQEARLGAWTSPSGDGWINFERCPFAIHRKPWVFGVNVKRGHYKCLSCGKTGSARDIGFPPDMTRLVRRGLTPRKVLAPSPVPETEPELPWKRITPRGPMPILERKAVEYVESRGVSRLRAAELGLGYGIAGPWLIHVIHPFFDDDGKLRGWQARLQGEPEDGEPKVRTTTRKYDGDWVWGAHDGAVYLLDRVPREAEVLVIVEGPYDAISVSRVSPGVALLGSHLTDAQMNRILHRRPREIIVAFDQDKTAEMKRVAGQLTKRTTSPVFWVDYPPGWAGDWAAVENGKPRCVDSVYEILKFFTEEFRVGA